LKKHYKQSVWICLVCILPITMVYGSDKNNSFYLSGKFIGGISEFENVQNSGAITGTLVSLDNNDTVGGFSGALGYKWQQFRFEAEYLWRYRFDFGAIFNGVPTIIGSNVNTQSVMLKSLWAYENGTRFTPYLGGGLGWAIHEADTNRGNIVTSVITNQVTTTDNLVWALNIGTTYSLTDNWSVDVGYSYTDLGDVEIGPYADGGKVDAEYVSHDITIGISYDF